jgi:CRISPR-associated protein Cas1
MKTIIIDRRKSQLSIEGQSLVIRLPEAPKILHAPLTKIRAIVIAASIEFSTQLLWKLTSAGISLIFVNGRKPSKSAAFYADKHGDVARKNKQYCLFNHQPTQLKLAKSIMQHKKHKFIQVLQKVADEKITTARKIAPVITQIEQQTFMIQQAKSINELMGIEGYIAKLFYKGYQHGFAPAFNFTGRNKRPPKDPVNVLISFSATLLHFEACRALMICGFDIQKGFYHSEAYKRESLGCDLIELIRPAMHYWIWQLCEQKNIRPEHFKQTSTQCYLQKAGREHFYQAYYQQLSHWQTSLLSHSKQLLKYCEQVTLP